MMKLKKNERLVYAGQTALRAPDGTPQPSAPQFIIVSFEEADPAAVTTLQGNERVVLAGRVFHEKQKAEERFAALKAGREVPPKEESIPFYVVLDAEDLNPKTGVPLETCKALRLAGKDLAGLIALHKRMERAAEKQGVTETT